MNHDWSVPLFETYWDEDDVSAVNKVIRRGSYWAAGPEIEEFELELSKFNQRRFAVVFNSGSSALHAMYQTLDIAGREVILPSFSFIATANAAVVAGATPIFAESEYDTYGLDARDVERKINSRTAAIVALHYSGCPSRDIQELVQLASKHNILLLEDNAHAMGALSGSTLAGNFGFSSATSFCQNKLISTGEGGAVFTDNEKQYMDLLLFRSHGRLERPGVSYFSTNTTLPYLQIGHNFRMPTMNAALGLSQLKKFDKVVDLRKIAANYLLEKLQPIDEIVLPKKEKQSDHFYQQFSIRIRDASKRDQLKDFLSRQGIFSNLYYEPIHLSDYYREAGGWSEGDLPNTEALGKTMLTLPMFPTIGRDQLDKIVNALLSFFH